MAFLEFWPAQIEIAFIKYGFRCGTYCHKTKRAMLLFCMALILIVVVFNFPVA